MSLTLPRQAANIVVDLATGPKGRRTLFVDQESADDDSSGRTWDTPKDTFEGILGVAQDDDVILVGPGQYDETVVVEQANLVFRGVGGRGGAYIEPETAAAEGMHILADDITLENIGVAGEETADFSLKVGSQTVAPARFRAKGCKFEGAPVILQSAGDVLFEDCEFAWEGALQFAAGDEGFCTQVTLKNCHFHNITAAHIESLAAGGVRNLKLIDCVFDNAEDGTAPSKFLDIAEADDTGIVTGCSFALATNASAKLDIAAGVLFVANKTEAGVSTGRPA